MSNCDFMQMIPDSQRYTSIDQLIATMTTLKFKTNNSILIEDEIDYILVGLKNSKRFGYDLILKEEKG